MSPPVLVTLTVLLIETMNQNRPPIVTILGHVDHGKTTLLDFIRKASVAKGEAGGITQAIGAYQTEFEGKTITFIDTPGHAAFEKMRSRGAHVADIAVLVVAADDAVMPQTVEAIKHIQAAKIPMIVAVSKIDLPNIKLPIQVEKVKRQLADNKILVEEYGGDVPIVQLSAVTGEGVDNFLSTIIMVSDIYEFKGDSDLPAVGVVIEARLDKFKGAVATVIVRNGSLEKGDIILAGSAKGKVRGMFDFKGQVVAKAVPSQPVEVLGFESVPEVGAKLGEEKAQAVAASLRSSILDQLMDNNKEQIINVVIKADNQGSLEAVEDIVNKLNVSSQHVRIIFSGTGNISDMDIDRASASHGIVIGFNVGTAPSALKVAEADHILIRNYKIIYELADELEEVVEGMLVSGALEEVFGTAQIIAEFPFGKNERIAGCKVLDGAISKGPKVRIVRGGEVIVEGKIKSLKKVREEVTRVEKGQDCGIIFDSDTTFQIGDIVESYRNL